MPEGDARRAPRALRRTGSRRRTQRRAPASTRRSSATTSSRRTGRCSSSSPASDQDIELWDARQQPARLRGRPGVRAGATCRQPSTFSRGPAPCSRPSATERADLCCRARVRAAARPATSSGCRRGRGRDGRRPPRRPATRRLQGHAAILAMLDAALHEPGRLDEESRSTRRQRRRIARSRRSATSAGSRKACRRCSRSSTSALPRSAMPRQHGRRQPTTHVGRATAVTRWRAAHGCHSPSGQVPRMSTPACERCRARPRARRRRPARSCRARLMAQGCLRTRGSADSTRPRELLGRARALARGRDASGVGGRCRWRSCPVGSRPSLATPPRRRRRCAAGFETADQAIGEDRVALDDRCAARGGRCTSRAVSTRPTRLTRASEEWAGAEDAYWQAGWRSVRARGPRATAADAEEAESCSPQECVALAEGDRLPPPPLAGADEPGRGACSFPGTSGTARLPSSSGRLRPPSRRGTSSPPSRRGRSSANRRRDSELEGEFRRRTPRSPPLAPNGTRGSG